MQTWFDTDDFATLEKTFLERNRRAPDDYDVVHGLQEVYYKWGKWPQALEWSTRAAALRPNDAEAQYGVGTFIWQILAAHGGGPDMAAYDPRPRPAPEDDAAGAAQAEAQGQPRTQPELVPPPPPPAAAPGDITGKARVELADQAIAHLEKALALRPHYADAMTYLALVWRQKSFGAVRRAGRLAAGGRSGERVAEARAAPRGPGRADDGVRGLPGASRGAGARGPQAALVRAVDRVPRRADRRRRRLFVLAHRGAVAAAAQGDVPVGRAAAAARRRRRPRGGGAAPRRSSRSSRSRSSQPKPEIVQPQRDSPRRRSPKEEPKTEDNTAKRTASRAAIIGGTPGGTIGGTPGGTIGGTPGGVVGAPPGAPKFLPPNMGQRRSCPAPTRRSRRRSKPRRLRLSRAGQDLRDDRPAPSTGSR